MHEDGDKLKVGSGRLLVNRLTDEQSNLYTMLVRLKARTPNLFPIFIPKSNYPFPSLNSPFPGDRQWWRKSLLCRLCTVTPMYVHTGCFRNIVFSNNSLFARYLFPPQYICTVEQTDNSNPICLSNEGGGAGERPNTYSESTCASNQH